VKVLKGITETPGATFNLRKVLVVLQFAVSMALITGTIIIYSQLAYLRTKSMGFDRDQVIMLPVSGIPVSLQYPSFKSEIERLSNVKSVTNVSHDIGQTNLAYLPLTAEGKTEEQMVPLMNAGYDFPQTFGVDMAAGRYFNTAYPSDSTLAFVINETAAKVLGWPDPIGRKLKLGFGGTDSSRVIGVIKDFNFDPLHSGIGPLAITFSGAFGNIAIKLGNGDHQETLKVIESIWTKLYPQVPFHYYFLDQGLRSTYADEGRISRIYTIFCSIALFIACMGLFALASYTIQKRLKEISMRKVLGASERSIILLIYREFFILIVIAFVIATPIAIMVFTSWLSTFAYHIALSPLFFIIALVSVISVSWLTLVFQMVRASRLNPAVVLKSE
jgi:putative ABC transport system permease protein